RCVGTDTSDVWLERVPRSPGMPDGHVWNVLQTDVSGTPPPCFFPWPHESTPEAFPRNQEGVEAAREMLAPVVRLAMAHAAKMGLHVDWSDGGATLSKLAVVAQTPKEFDFPGVPWPPQFH